MTKHVAVVQRVLHRNQFIGLPDGLSSDGEPRDSMPQAEVLVIEGASMSWMFLRYTREGDFAGDTWHASLEEAFSQANYEFGSLEWKPLPDGVNPIDHAFGKG